MIANENDLVQEAIYKAARTSPADYARVVSGFHWKPYRLHQEINYLLISLSNRQIRRLMLLAPPQHGKSQEASQYFPSWYLGHNPDHRFIQGAYESSFAEGWGRKSRAAFEEYNPAIFGKSISNSSSAAKHWEIEGHKGSYDAVGMNGAFTGKPADVIDIEDPHKNRLEASSQVYQKRIWETYTDAIDTRLSRIGIILLIMTPWHVNDLRGQILANEPYVLYEDVYNELANGANFKDEWVVARFPALAEENDILGRKKGEALCPELHPKDKLLASKNRRSSQSWAALFQGNPIPDEGDMFDYDYFEIVDEIPKQIEDSLRWWDLAGTRKKHSAYTSGVLCAITPQKDFFILDEVRLKAKPGAVRKKAYTTAENDGVEVKIRIPLDPGQAALDQQEQYEEKFIGYNFKAVPEKPMGSKEQRAELVATHGELHKIKILKGEWNDEFIDEFIQFPNGKYKDRVDATSGAYHELLHSQDESDVSVDIGYLDW